MLLTWPSCTPKTPQCGCQTCIMWQEQQAALTRANHAGAMRLETAGRQAAERARAADLAQLHTKPPSLWPPDLQRLVEQREAAAAEVLPLPPASCSALGYQETFMQRWCRAAVPPGAAQGPRDEARLNAVCSMTAVCDSAQTAQLHCLYLQSF